MRRIADYIKIQEVSRKIDEQRINLLDQKERLNKELDSLLQVDKTPVITRLIEEYRKSIMIIDNISDGISYYVNYMDNISRQYNEIYGDFKYATDKYKGGE